MLTILPRDNKWRTQKQAIAHHNERKERMLSMADVWQLAKENNTETINELRKEWKGLDWSVTSTRIVYNKNNLSGKLIHNVDSKVTKPTEIKLKEVPVCRPTYLKELIATQSGLTFVRALINDKKATKEEITKCLAILSGKTASKIRFWTPEQRQRKGNNLRAVRLCFSVVGFSVYGVGWGGDGDGLSRGVKIDSASKKQSKIKEKDIFKEGYNQAIADIIKQLGKMKKS